MDVYGDICLFVSLYFHLYWNIGCMHRSIGDIRPLWTVRYGQQRMNSLYPVISLQTQIQIQFYRYTFLGMTRRKDT